MRSGERERGEKGNGGKTKVLPDQLLSKCRGRKSVALLLDRLFLCERRCALRTIKYVFYMCARNIPY